MPRSLMCLQNWARFAGFVALFGGIIVCSFLFAISYPPPIATLNGDPGQTGEQSNADEVETRRNKDRPLPLQQNERKEVIKATNERGLTVATWLLAFATVGTTVAISVQAFLFIWQLRLIRGTLEQTEEASRTAATQAKAIVAANSPIPVIAEIKLVPYESWEAADGAADRVHPGEPIPECCRVLPCITNIGRHSMRITSFCIERVLLDPDADLPEQPRYHSIDNRWQPWLVPFTQQWFRPADDITALDFSAEQRAAIAAGQQRLWNFWLFHISECSRRNADTQVHGALGCTPGVGWGKTTKLCLAPAQGVLMQLVTGGGGGLMPCSAAPACLMELPTSTVPPPPASAACRSCMRFFRHWS
jgi:hypothetical protein